MSAQLYREKCQIAPNDASADNAEDNPRRQITTKSQVRKGFRDITVVQMYSMYGEEDEVKLTSEYAPPQKKESAKESGKFDKYAVLVRRVVERKAKRDVLVRTELCIQSHTLCQTLRDLIPYTFDRLDMKSTPIVLPAPFFELFFKRKEIEAYLSDLGNAEELRAEVKLVHKYLQKDKLTIGNLEEHTGLIQQGTISFGTMWTLFPPNELLVRNDGAMVECLVCRDLAVDPKIPMCWQVTGVRLDFDGHDIGLAKTTYPISFAGRVNGAMDIAQLPLIPAKYLEGWAETKSELVKRGEAFRELLGGSLEGHAYRGYEGPLWDECELDKPPVSKINQRVVVDYKTYLKKEPKRAATIEREAKAKKSGRRTMRGTGGSSGSSSASSNSDTDSDTDDFASDPDMASNSHFISGEDQGADAFSKLLFAVSEKYGIKDGMDDLLLLCPARVPGYCLTTKEWGWMLIDELKRIESSDTAFNSLQIDYAHQKTGEVSSFGAPKWRF